MSDVEIGEVGPDAAAALARLHALCFAPLPETPWSESAFRTILRMPGTLALVARVSDGDAPGLLVGRVTADEAELLTLCVAPDSRRAGLARRLLKAFLDRVGTQTRVALEVAVENEPAIALYRALAFEQVGRRPGYYAAQGRKVDALVFVREAGLRR